MKELATTFSILFASLSNYVPFCLGTSSKGHSQQLASQVKGTTVDAASNIWRTGWHQTHRR